MWLMLQQPEPDDYVIATGETHSVREFVEVAFRLVDLDWHRYVEVDPRYFRPAEVDLLMGDASKAKRQLGWEPRVRFEELVRLMVVADLEAVHQEIHGSRGGKKSDILEKLTCDIDNRQGTSSDHVGA
jgi:GDPmannose 4,6-dehydratase